MMTSKISASEIAVRTILKPGDLGYLVYMHGKIYEQEYGYGLRFEAYVAEGISEFYTNYNPLLDGVWILEHNQVIVGFLFLMHRDKEVAQLRYFLIDPDYRGIGLGKKLASLFLTHLAEKNYKRAYLWTTDELFNAAGIYLQMGFRLSEEKNSDSFGKNVREQRYDLFL